MSDSQRPNPPDVRPPSFEVPDLELDPAPRSFRQAAPAPARPAASAPANGPPNAQDQLFGASFDFGADLGDFELERSAQPSVHVAEPYVPRAPAAKRAEPAVSNAEPGWPTGRAPDAPTLAIDAREIALLADYGDAPTSAPLTIGYAYRVFTRQRELKQQLIPLVAESERAHTEREAALVELARALRPTIEPLSEFRRFLGPLRELEQRAAARGQALNAINAQLGAETGQIDIELAQIASRITVEQQLEREAQRECDEREANVRRADAKLQRVQIEMRAAEAAQLAALQQRAEALRPELAQTRAEFEHAQQALKQVQARLDTLRQAERQNARKKQALGGAYQKEVSARAQGLSESEIEQRAALADLGRAMLAARGTVEISADWIERLRYVCERADKLMVRAELQRRAIAAYDVERARQGVKLAGTAVGLVFVLFTLKLVF